MNLFEMIIHVVSPGENLYRISQKYMVPIDRIIEDNDLKDPNLLLVGQALVIRKNNLKHIVQKGESLYSIASLYNIPIERLYASNNLTSDSVIYPGTVLTIDFSNHDKNSIEVNGYVYPEQNLDDLRKMLPYLTYLSIFSYTVNHDGSLNPINDEELIRLAKEEKVAPLMVITNIENERMFSSDLASTILNNTEVQDKLIENVLGVLKEKGYYGVDVDFEYIYPEDRDSYINFLDRLASKIKPAGFKLSVAVAPKTSEDMQGLLYEAHDYERIGEIADRVIIMTYEWGYSFSDARSVAPVDKVREVIEYAVSVIPRNKILMGVPNYGYNFRVPRIEDVPAISITNFEALDIARENLVEIKFDYEAMSPYFIYTDTDNVTREVHFEDVRSYQAKLNLVNEYGLAGISIWTLRSYFNPFWILLAKNYDVVKF